MTVSQLESWNQILASRNKKERIVLEVLRQNPDGLTAWEVAEIARLSPNPHRQDVAPRLTELVDADLVVETGERRTSPTGKPGEVYMLRSFWEEKRKKLRRPGTSAEQIKKTSNYIDSITLSERNCK